MFIFTYLLPVRTRNVSMVAFDRVNRLGPASALFARRFRERRVRGVLSMLSTIRITIRIGIAMFRLAFTRRLQVARLSTSKFIGQAILRTCVIGCQPTIRYRRVNQLTNFRASRNPCQANVASNFSIFVRSNGVSIHGRAMRVFRPHLCKRAFMYTERVLRFCYRSKGCPHMVVLVRHNGAGSSINYVGPNTIRRVITRCTRDRPFRGVRVGQFNCGPMDSGFAILYRVSVLLVLVPFFTIYRMLVRPFGTAYQGNGAPKTCGLRRAIRLFRLLVRQHSIVTRSRRFRS